MALSDYFRRNPEPKPSIEVSGKFWTDVESVCHAHVLNTIDFFKKHKAPRLEWAEPRFQRLVKAKPLKAILNIAKTRPQSSTCVQAKPPIFVGKFDSWHVCVTAFPSPADTDFLNACPDRRVERYLEDSIRDFHNDEPAWENWDYALWILLLSPTRRGASVHLFTQWHLSARSKWFKERVDGLVVEAPAIQPTDLMKDSVHELYRRMAALDFEALRRPVRDVARQTAKLVVVDSPVSEKPTDPAQPFKNCSTESQVCAQAAELLHKHRRECEEVEEIIPQILGIPSRYAAGVSAYLRSVDYAGLRAERVRIREEPEVPYLDEKGEILMHSPYELRTYLSGGGTILAAILEDGLLAQFWLEGIRWLMIAPAANSGAQINDESLQRLACCNSDGLIEVTNRSTLPDSRLILLHAGGRFVCVDDRRLRTSQLEHLRESPFVGTGTFWVRCESLASVFGIDRRTLTSSWKPDEWKGKIADKLMKEHAIVCRGDDGERGFAIAIPIWQALSLLQMEAFLVGPERVDFR